LVENAVDIAISCITPSDCRKYTQSKDYIFEVSPVDQNDLSQANTYTYSWSITPSSIPYSKAYDRFRLSKNELTLTADTARVQVSLVGDSLSGTSFLDLPINEAPTGGDFTVSPESGLSVS